MVVTTVVVEISAKNFTAGFGSQKMTRQIYFKPSVNWIWKAILL